MTKHLYRVTYTDAQHKSERRHAEVTGVDEQDAIEAAIRADSAYGATLDVRMISTNTTGDQLWETHQ